MEVEQSEETTGIPPRRIRNLLEEMKESLKMGMDKNQREIEKIIKKAEKSLVHTGEKMGLDYMHFKREAE